jgi:hypothetical protein
MSVEVATSPTFQAAAPKLLFAATVNKGIYDLSPDGKRFLLAIPAQQSGGDPITVVLNWTAALKK